jgi:hypothetical protein
MTRKDVTSSNLRTVGYDPATRTLEIEFHKSGVYRYADVPLEVYEGLMAADSHGSYFTQHIKEAYSYRKVS